MRKITYVCDFCGAIQTDDVPSRFQEKKILHPLGSMSDACFDCAQLALNLLKAATDKIRLQGVEQSIDTSKKV